MPTASRPSADLGPGGLAIFLWAVGGVLLLLGRAIWRLAPVALDAFDHTLAPIHWAFLPPWLLFMGYSEWWRGFHRRFSPRVAVRADWLARHPSPLLVLLAPAFAIGLLHARRRRLMGSWGVLLAIVVAIAAVRHLPQPWRGVVDLGVVLGLAAGALSTLWFAARTLTGRPPAVPAELPEHR